MLGKPPLIIIDPCRPWRYPHVLRDLVGSPVELWPHDKNPLCHCPTRLFIFDYKNQRWLEKLGEELRECLKEAPESWPPKLLTSGVERLGYR